MYSDVTLTTSTVALFQKCSILVRSDFHTFNSQPCAFSLDNIIAILFHQIYPTVITKIIILYLKECTEVNTRPLESIELISLTLPDEKTQNVDYNPTLNINVRQTLQ